LPAIALAAYSYMALVPIIQPPIIRALTTEKERQCPMKVTRKVSQKEKIIFPIAVTIFVSLLVPSATTLIGCLMLGNLIREVKLVPKLSEVLQNVFMYIITVILGLTVGAKAEGNLFLSKTTLIIIMLGLIAFAVGTASGVLMGKLMYYVTKGKVNPMIGAAGVSAVPMAARVVHLEGQKANPHNYLLMYAMGPNVAGVIGSAVAAGVLLAFFQ
ncbi:MAG: sodium ion-translocating decarboxylase subunit beta, partial [Enterococcus cecorum]|nr:sodium ion-translocating decarboxylase subunit beta [Enterococcus cecorum]